jgi:signal recognition particle-docking protein FtsY
MGTARRQRARAALARSPRRAARRIAVFPRAIHPPPRGEPSPMFDLFRRKPVKPTAPADLPDATAIAVSPLAPAMAPPAEAPVAAPTAVDPSAGKGSWRERLRSGLGLSRDKFSGALSGVFRRRVLDDAALDELESALLMADVGVEATRSLLDDLRIRYHRAGASADPRTLLRDALADLVRVLESPADIGPSRPYVIMLAGVNGAGKTTSIGKIAKWLQARDLSVLLAAGDTFRAAAREQLSVWGERNRVAVIQQAGGDPGAVMFDALGAATSRGIDVVLADTAGRLPTQAHLMDELRKIRRVLGKARPGAPDECWLVLDANTGQNALAQVRAFDAAIGLTGLILTKLDGSAKGGIVAAIARQHPIPLKFIGVGEGLDDLRPFNADEFVDALLPRDEDPGRDSRTD